MALIFTLSVIHFLSWLEHAGIVLPQPPLSKIHSYFSILILYTMKRLSDAFDTENCVKSQQFFEVPAKSSENNGKVSEIMADISRPNVIIYSLHFLHRGHLISEYPADPPPFFFHPSLILSLLLLLFLSPTSLLLPPTIRTSPFLTP